MIQFYYQQGNRRRKIYKAVSGSCSMGSARNNDLVLRGTSIAKRHSLLEQRASGIFISDLGSSSGTWVNRKRIRDYGPLSELDDIVLGDISIWIDGDNVTTSQPGHHAAIKSEPGSTPAQIPFSNSDPESIADFQHTSDKSDLLYWADVAHQHLLSEMDLRRKDVNRMSDAELRDEAVLLLDDIIDILLPQLPNTVDVKTLKESVVNEAVGLGPLEQFLTDDTITEIMVNGPHDIFIEKAGRMSRSTSVFSSDQAVYAVIERIITPLGRRIDESSPIVDARLNDGSRVNAIIPPLAINGPSLTIRKFPKKTT